MTGLLDECTVMMVDGCGGFIRCCLQRLDPASAQLSPGWTSGA